MVDERLQRGASGHLLKTATGHLANTCGADCDNCAGKVPRSIDAVIAGVTWCGCDGIRTRATGTIRAAVTMAYQTGSAPTTCIWVYTDTNAATIEDFPGFDCPGGAHNDTPVDVVYTLEKASATTWVFRIWLGIFAFLIEVFYDVQTVAADNCDLGVVFTNDWVVGDCWTTGGPQNKLRVAYGGTATI